MACIAEIVGMRPKVSAKELEVRRQIAGRLLREGKGTREVARLVGASPSSVDRWKKTMATKGLKGLTAKPHPGRRPRLSLRKKERLKQILLQGPQASGFSTDLWTLARVAEVIERRFAVAYHPGHVWYLLRDLGWSPQKPERRARERNERTIEAWRQSNWPRIKKSAKKGLAHRFS